MKNLLLIVFLAISKLLHAGGIHLSNVRIFSEESFNSQFHPKEYLTITYHCEGYFSNTYSINPAVLFRLIRMNGIKASVGKGGVNNPADIRKVAQYLFEKGYLLDQNSNLKDIIKAIYKFQKDLNFDIADGRVDARGNSEYYLNPPIYFYKSFEGIHDHISFNGVAFFYAPNGIGDYEISYNRIAYFPNSSTMERFGDYYKNYFAKAGEIKISSEQNGNQTVKGKLRLNGKMPFFDKSPTDLIYDNNRLDFSWLIEKPRQIENIQYQYILKPLSDSWSEWIQDTNISLPFAPKGYNLFEVRCRYLVNNHLDTVSLSTLTFELKENFTSKKIYSKGFEKNSMEEFVYINEGQELTARTNKEVIQDLYKSSKALIISLGEKYDNFDPLPYISNDILELEKTLKNQLFNVEKKNVYSNQEFENSIDQFLDEINFPERRTRVLIYVTGHGFSKDGNFFLATQNCNNSTPYSSCIDFTRIREKFDKFKRAKHKLIIVDACSSGVGQVYKSAEESYAKVLASQDGYSMISAGMSDQEAEMNDEIKMSIFTHYLCKGLNGEADIAKDQNGLTDSFITLNELIVYLQNRVSKDSKKQQLPLLGRINGIGEMIFLTNNN